MNTNYPYKTVLTRHQGMRMTMRPRTAMHRRRRQAIIGTGISVFIITLGFVITLNVSDNAKIQAAVNETIAASQTEAAMDAGKFSLTWSAPADEVIEISLIAEDGSEVLKTTQKALKGINYFEQKSSFADGVYFAQIKTGDSSQILRIVNN
ncbi:MAG TPA: T9SS type A sorting domain-containing protein [Bacteroidia bacterium]|nr:T9SS type A sorting domain-containing protein [Bacteroidia bacterium]